MTEPTDEQLRVRIAEFTGDWEWWEEGAVEGASIARVVRLIRKPSEILLPYLIENGWTPTDKRVVLYELPHGLPDYPRDLNVMAAAEAKLTDEQFIRYAHYLSNRSSSFRVSIDAVAMSIHVLRRCFTSATARQRALAFVRTVEGSEV